MNFPQINRKLNVVASETPQKSAVIIVVCSSFFSLRKEHRNHMTIITSCNPNAFVSTAVNLKQYDIDSPSEIGS